LFTATAATAVFARAGARVAGGLSPIGEARPVTDLPAQHLEAQRADTTGNLRLSAVFLDDLGHRLLLGLHRLDEADQRLKPLDDPGGGLFADEPPRLARPPLAGDVDAVGGEQAMRPIAWRRCRVKARSRSSSSLGMRTRLKALRLPRV